MSFYEKISKLRKAQGISQEDLAQELNISRQAVYKWETGQSMPDIDNLILLSKKFNVTVDYLLNDSIEEFCSTPTNTRSRQYGKVFRTSLTPADVDLEKDNTRRTKNEANKIKIRKLSIILSFICGLLLVSIGIISLWKDNGSGFPRTQIILCAVGLSLTILGLIFDKFLFKNIYMNRDYFFQEQTSVKANLKEKGYWFEILQPDLLAWFFFDPKTKNFGFVFGRNEQFICPIQNYFSFICTASGGGNFRTGKQLIGGPIIGGAGIQGFNAVAIPKYIQRANNIFNYLLTYYNDKGEPQEYTFALTTHRKYLISYCDDIETAYDIMNMYSDFTVKAFQKIKNKLELEKNNLNACPQ